MKIAIIGSGPVSIIEAIYQAKLGNQVTLFEKTSRLGGAWGTVQYNDAHEFELGCHIWDYHKSTYAFIENLLEEPLDTLEPKPTILIREKEIPYDWKNNLLIFKNIKHDIGAFISGKTFVKPSVIPKTYKYPSGGCKRMMEKLTELLLVNKVELRKEYHVKSIHLNNGRPCLNEDEAEIYDLAIFTSLSELDKIVVDGEDIPIKKRRTIFTHYHLILNGKLKKPLSYVRVMDHDFIHRISDMSSQSTSGELVLSVGVFKNKMDNFAPNNGEEEMMKALVKYGYIGRSVKLIKSYSNQFDGGTIDHHLIKKLQQLDGIEVLRSTNLIFSIKNHLNRWKTLL